MASLLVRRVHPDDYETVHELCKDGLMSCTGAMFVDALLKGYEVHLRAAFAATVVCSLAYGKVSTPVLAVIGVLAYGIIPFLAYTHGYLSMFKEADRAISRELAQPDDYYSDKGLGKGSHFWVVVRAPEDETSEEKEKVVGCVGLAKLLSGEAEMQHLYVAKEEQRRGIASTLIKHVMKHARTHGFKAVTANAAVAQRQACKVLEKAGFTKKFEHKQASWWVVRKYIVDVK